MLSSNRVKSIMKMTIYAQYGDIEMLQKNATITLDITGMTQEGYGVGRVDDMVVFVRSAAVGDRVEALVLKVAKTYAWAKITRILAASPDRAEDMGCPVAGRCGGCTFRHVTYEAEVRAKVQRVKDALVRIGKQSGDISPDRVCPACGPDGSSAMENYRNKAIYPVTKDKSGNVKVGFYSTGSHNVVECDHCNIQNPLINKCMQMFRSYLDMGTVSVYDENTGKGLLRGLYLRTTTTGSLMVTVILNTSGHEALERQRGGRTWLLGLVGYLTARMPEVVSVYANWHTKKDNVMMGTNVTLLWGQATVREVIMGVEFDISPLAFLQINPIQTEKLYGIACDYATEGAGVGGSILDLYCGTGTIGLCLASRLGDKGVQIIGVDTVPQAIEDARHNAELNNMTNCRYICGTAEAAAVELASQGMRANTCIIDPPRHGCGPEIVEALDKLSPDRIVYVSCKPETLARDVLLLEGIGYRMDKYSVVDMFPRTGHVESVVCLTRK